MIWLAQKVPGESEMPGKLPPQAWELFARLAGPWQHQPLMVQLNLNHFRMRRNVAHPRLIERLPSQARIVIDKGEILRTFRRRPLRAARRLRPDLNEIRNMRQFFAG